MSRPTTPEPPIDDIDETETPIPEWLKTASDALKTESEGEPPEPPEPVEPYTVPESDEPEQPSIEPQPEVTDESTSSTDLPDQTEDTLPPYSLVDLSAKVNDILARLVQLECTEATVTQPAAEVAPVIEPVAPVEDVPTGDTRIIPAPRRGRSYVPTSRNIFMPFYGFRR